MLRIYIFRVENVKVTVRLILVIIHIFREKLLMYLIIEIPLMYNVIIE